MAFIEGALGVGRKNMVSRPGMKGNGQKSQLLNLSDRCLHNALPYRAAYARRQLAESCNNSIKIYTNITYKLYY